MKITLHFDTSNPEEELEYKQLMKAKDALGALYDLQQNLRNMIKYGKVPNTDLDLNNGEIQGLIYAKGLLIDTLDEHKIDLEELYS